MGMSPSEKNAVMTSVKNVNSLMEDIRALNDKVDQEQSKAIAALEKRVAALEDAAKPKAAKPK